jgi:hypothetical protein
MEDVSMLINGYEEGGSFALGLWGYINAMKEIADSKENYTHIVCAVGSGGTLGNYCVLYGDICVDWRYYNRRSASREGTLWNERHQSDWHSNL